MTLKPHAALFWVLCAVIAARYRSWAVSAWRAAGLVIAGGLLAPGAVFGWLAWRGGLGPFVDIFAGYVVPLDSRVGRVGAWQAIGWHSFRRPLAGLFLLLIALALIAPPARDPPQGPGDAGCAVRARPLRRPGQGVEYQLYPLVVSCCALAPAAVVAWRLLDWPHALDLFGARRPLAVAVRALLVIVLGAKGGEALDAPWIAQKARRATAITRDLGPLVPPGATVQVLDTTAGGIHALLRLGIRQPTRFIYDFHFFHDVADPRIQALRAELVAGLERGRPTAVLVLEDTWPQPGYARLAAFPELA